MNILSICFKHRQGGYNKKLYQVYKTAAVNGHNVHVLSAEPLPVSHDRIFNHVLKIPCSASENLVFWFLFCLGAIFETHGISRKIHIDRIVNFGPIYAFLSIVPVLVKRIPSIVFIRADNMKHSTDRLRNLFFRIVDGLGLKMTEKIIFNSSTLEKAYRGRYRLEPGRCSLVPNHITGCFSMNPEKRVALRMKMGFEDHHLVLSTSGVFSTGKNFDFLIKAMPELRDFHVRLMIIGDEMVVNGEKQRLRQIAERCGVADVVVFCGWQDRPEKYIRCSDAFVFPSRYEGSPNSLLEALSCKIPCFGSDIPEIREVLHYDDLVFSIKDNVEFICMMRMLARDKNFYFKTVQLSEKRCRHYMFDWHKEIMDKIFCLQ